MVRLTESMPEVNTLDSPLSSAALRYSIRTKIQSDGHGPHETRPFGLRFARVVSIPMFPVVRFCHDLQVAVDNDGRPVVERMDWEEDQRKEWATKADSDGVEGPEEEYGWEEQ